MAKKSHKRPTQAGCMGGLISIFDFRHGRFNRKLISDRRRGSNRQPKGAGYSKSGINLMTNGDKKHNSEEVTVSNLSDGNETKTTKIESGQRSVKALIYDELSKAQFSKKQIPRPAVERITPDMEWRGHSGYNHKQTYKTCKVACNLQLHHDSEASASLEPHRSYHPIVMERSLPREQDMHLNHTNRTDSFLAQKSSSHMNMQQVQNHFLKEKLNEATESFLNQKLMDAKRLIGDEATHQSKEFMDALEVLNSNKELFLKLLQDPNSLLVKHIQDLRNTQLEKVSNEKTGNSTQSEKPISHEKFQKQSAHKIFRRKDKTQNESKKPTKGSESSYASNRIVVLKPSPESVQHSTTKSPSSTMRSNYIMEKEVESERVTTLFSIRKITRKLKNAIGESRKEWHWISRDMSKSTAEENQSSVKNKVALHNSDNKINSNTTATECSRQRGSTVYEEGKKHPVKMLNFGDTHEDQLMRRVSRSMDRMLSQTEYNMLSPRLSPGRDKEPTSVPGHMRFFSPYESLQYGSENIQQFKKNTKRPNIESSSCTDCNNQDRELLQVPNSNSEIFKEHITDTKTHMNKGSSPKGCNEMVQVTYVDMEGSNTLDVPSEPDNRVIAYSNHNNDATDTAGEQGYFKCLRMDSSEEKPTQASTLSSFAGAPLLIHEIKVASINEKPEGPSPVSVLEPFFVEDVISPTSPQHAELAVEPQPIHLEEQEMSAPWITTLDLDPQISSRTSMNGKEYEFEYVRTLMEASGISYGEFIGTWHSSDQLLPPSLFDEVEASSAHLPDNRKLIFDCINEVLVEVYERFFSCSPWVSSVKTNIWAIPVGKHVAQEVWRGIDWHLFPQFPHTLDQIIGKDMTKAGTWMDLRFDVEGVGIEMGEIILEEIMVEMILELWN